MLKIEDLSVKIGKNLLVENCSFFIPEGTITAMVGESGSGKTTLASTVLGMLPPDAKARGRVLLHEKDLLSCSAKKISTLRKSIIFTVFQDASNSFNPSIKMRRQLYELAGRRKGDTITSFNEKMSGILESLGMGRELLNRYPFELSGGMLQRCMMACAFYVEPELLIADEVTSAVDTIIQKDIVNLLKQLNREKGATIWLITHDLELTLEAAHHLVVMSRGRVVEQGPVAQVLAHPRHAYTKRLLDSRF